MKKKEKLKEMLKEIPQKNEINLKKLNSKIK